MLKNTWPQEINFIKECERVALPDIRAIDVGTPPKLPVFETPDLPSIGQAHNNFANSISTRVRDTEKIYNKAYGLANVHEAILSKTETQVKMEINRDLQQFKNKTFDSQIEGDDLQLQVYDAQKLSLEFQREYIIRAVKGHGQIAEIFGIVQTHAARNLDRSLKENRSDAEIKYFRDVARASTNTVYASNCRLQKEAKNLATINKQISQIGNIVESATQGTHEHNPRNVLLPSIEICVNVKNEIDPACKCRESSSCAKFNIDEVVGAIGDSQKVSVLGVRDILAVANNYFIGNIEDGWNYNAIIDRAHTNQRVVEGNLKNINNGLNKALGVEHREIGYGAYDLNQFITKNKGSEEFKNKRKDLDRGQSFVSIGDVLPVFKVLDDKKEVIVKKQEQKKKLNLKTLEGLPGVVDINDLENGLDDGITLFEILTHRYTHLMTEGRFNE